MKLDGNDRFALDGARLISIAGTDGADGTTYEKELTDFSRIKSIGQSVSGTASWTVETKAGLKYTYGGTADSQVKLPSRQEVLTWLVSTVEDTVGNQIWFTYENDGAANSASTRIKQIDYTCRGGIGTNPTKNHVDFIYAPRTDIRTSYFLGAKIVSDQVLIAIESVHDGAVVRHYDLKYQPSELSGQSQLISVTETGSKPSDGGAAPSFTPTTFTWQAQSGPPTILNTSAQDPALAMMGFSSNSSLFLQGDFRGDGHMGVMKFDGAPSTFWLATGNNGGTFTFFNAPAGFTQVDSVDLNTARLRTGDFNGDGKTDILHISIGGTNNWLALSNGDGTFNVTRGSQLGALQSLAQFNGNLYEILALDLTGDGCTDVVFLDAGGNNRVFIAKPDGSGSFTEKAIPAADPFRQFAIDDRDTTNTFVVPGDFNGDGLADILILFHDGGQHIHRMAVSNGDGSFSVRQSAQLGGIDGKSFLRTRGAFVSADFEGDGSTDLINFSNGYPAWRAFCQGDGTFTPVELSIASLPTTLQQNIPQYSSFFAGDFNGDGIADIYQNYVGHPDLSWVAFGAGASQFTVLQGAALGAMSNTTSIDIGNNRDRVATRILVGDFDGDGKDDVLTLNYPGYNYGNFLGRFTGFESSRITQVTNGHGGYSRFEYTPMTNPSVYTKGTGAVYPATDVQAAMQVVSRMFTRNGADGDASVPDPAAAAQETSMSYHYYETVAYLNGRGMLSPRIVRQINDTTGIQTTIYQETGDPLLSSFPKQALTRLSDGTKISDTTNTWTLQPRNTTANHRTYFAFATSSQKLDYEINSNTVVRRTTTTIPVSGGYDDHGNLLSSNETIDDGLGGANSYVTTTANAYGKDQTGAKWILGRLTSATVTKTAPSSSPSARTSTFDYDGSTGLLTSEVIEPNDAKLRLEKTYVHDPLGNITDSTETAWNGTGAPSPNQTRKKHTDYSPDGRFIIKTFNGLGHEEDTDHELLLGQVTHQKGPNKIETFWEFDGFGRPNYEMRADGSETRSTYLRATPGQGGAPARAVHRVVTQSSAAPAQTIWYDVLDREIQRDAIGFDGSAIFARKIFNNRGETIAASNPTFSWQSPAYTTMEYDAISREIKHTLPGNFVSTVSYNGLTTVATNSEGQKHTRVATLLDKLGSALDHFGKPLSYSHDAAGNLASVTDSSGNATALTFDNRGNKTAMTEPNTGKTTYEYDGFGELIAQTTSDGMRTTFTYDVLGRLIMRAEFAPDKKGKLQPTTDGVSKWFYDSFTDLTAGFSAHSLGKLISAQNTSFREDHRYDSFGRPVETITRIGLENFSTTTSYDYVGRVDTLTYPTAFAIRNIYNQFGHLAEVQNAASSASYWKATQVNARGQVEAESLGNGLVTQRTFYPNNGLVLGIQTGAAGGSLHEVQNLAYNHNSIGTFVQRQDIGRTMTETFSYDEVNRLKQVSITGVTAEFPTVDVQYDDLGNPTSRTDAGIYTYSPTSGPHAVTGLTGRPDHSPDLRYSYDARGNRIKTERLVGKGWVTDLNIKFNIANLPVEIASPAVAKGPGFPEARHSSGSTFSYTPDRARYRQVQKVSGAIKVDRFYIGSLYEREKRGATKRHIHYIPAGTGVVAIQQSEEGPTTIGGERTLYVHKDHLGSVESLTNQSGGLVEHLSFDAWGRRREVALTGGAYAVSYPVPDPFPAKNVSRGFTGHEMLDAFGIVHMNGRLYDPLTGRFLSADPIVQELDNLQNLNRYSYVLNNPLTLTDPSGFSFIGKYWKQIIVAVVAVALAFVAPYLLGGLAELAGSSLFAAGSFSAAVGAGAIAGFGGAFTGTLLAGGSLGDALRAGAIGGAAGALSAGVANGVGTAFSPDGQLSDYSQFKSLAHGLTQGAISSAEGGKFSHSFLSAGFADLAGGPIDRIQGTDTLHVAERTAAAAVVGGTAERLGGGKFANGAVTGAFVHLFNDESHPHLIRPRTIGFLDRIMTYALSDDMVDGIASFQGLPQNKIDELAGIESGLTFGLSPFLYRDGMVNESSGNYREGEWIGFGLSVVGSAGATGVAAADLAAVRIGTTGRYYSAGVIGAISAESVSIMSRTLNKELIHLNLDLATRPDSH